MRLTVFVTPARLDLSVNHTIYHRTGRSSESERKAVLKAYDAQLDHVGGRVLEQAIQLMKMHDVLLMRGIAEDDIRNAEIDLGLSIDSAIPEIQGIGNNQLYGLLTGDNGEILFGVRMLMTNQGFVEDHTYINNDKKKPR